jgi:DNA-3-methyladenine glycosylase
MAARRGLADPRRLCSGPGRVCQALGITGEHDGLALDEAPFEILASEGPVEVMRAKRIGISRAVHHEWRYGLAGSPFVSRRFPA